ncbi:hypothetical protein [Spirillospora sp. NBC_01491]|uniref:hypothetical protein n=1 Tax=Spirillospora sp. NBC_01491 TaxID=2976007 RepID=UPI002E37AB6F|nr:hypothetical protein [Spirillospora sp. NBC_01491]
MNINYSDLLPASRSCEHLSVSWTLEEPNGQSHVLVSVSCQGCRASVSKVRIERS